MKRIRVPVRLAVIVGSVSTALSVLWALAYGLAADIDPARVAPVPIVAGLAVSGITLVGAVRAADPSGPVSAGSMPAGDTR